MELYTNHHGQPTPPAPPVPVYDLTRDPIFYGTLVFFVLLTTAVPGLMGQPNFMPVIQATALTIFTAIALRRGGIDPALRVATVWLVVQGLFLFLITWLLPVQIEKAIHDGFLIRSGLMEWAYTGSVLPGSLLAAPLARLGDRRSGGQLVFGERRESAGLRDGQPVAGNRFPTGHPAGSCPLATGSTGRIYGPVRPAHPATPAQQLEPGPLSLHPAATDRSLSGPRRWRADRRIIPARSLAGSPCAFVKKLSVTSYQLPVTSVPPTHTDN
jgi:hypothetical protein